MENKSAHRSKKTLNPADISRIKKERFLKQLSEDEFRDKVVRPLFLRKGYRDGREICGQDEEGKDTIFVNRNRLGMEEVWVVQTKVGNLNLSSKASNNTVTAATQLRTALNTKVVMLARKEKLLPTYAVLCTSGKINNAARRYICDQVSDPRVVFMDKEEIIPMIDEYYAEFWWGIDADRFPYLRKLRDALLASSDTITLSELDIDGSIASPITDDMYVPLYLHRLTSKRVKFKGQVYKEPDLEQLPIQAVLGRRENLIHVVGDAGTGKSTALRRFAYSIADKAFSDTNVSTIPVVLKCTDIGKSRVPLLDLVTQVILGYVDSNKPCFCEDDLSKGNLLVLVDALDEVPDADRPYVISRLSEFHEKYQNCKIVLTSRNYSSIINLPELNTFTRFTITPIDLKQAQHLLERLSRGRSLPVEQGNEILRQLHDVHELELNPLLVTVFVATSDFSRRDIPANITELFKKFTEMMLGRWDMKKGLSQQYQSIVKDFLLRRLAFQMHYKKQTVIPISNCKEIFRHELKERGYEAELDIMFDETVYRSGLFRVEGDSLAFRHTLLQEFFAGRGVPSHSFFQGVVTDDHWKNAFVFYFGEHPDAHAELAELIENVSGFDGLQLYRATVAIGLAIQSCYLSKVSEKVQSMGWVMDSLARAKEGFLETLQERSPEFPLSEFLSYYIYARDSVACASISNEVFAEAERILSESGSEISEVRAFWHLVSLVESGSLDKVELLLKRFKPSDLRLLLALHLGCFLIAKLRVTSKEEGKSATRICEAIGPKIVHLRKQVWDELKSMLLEVRRGKIQPVLPGKEEASDRKKIGGKTSPVRGRFEY